jgi:thiol-disulfide isomerase/thioredoxin
MALKRAAVLLVAAPLAIAGVATFSVEAMVPRPAPAITAEHWLNSEPLGAASLRGKVVLVEFWTFACWNCENIEPHVKRWHETYADDGLVVIAVHTPEFSFERDVDNVRAYVEEHDIRYAVAIDNDFSTWKAFGNWAWPTLYLIDRDGVIQHTKVGEGGYPQTEARIRDLLKTSSERPPGRNGDPR